MVSDYTNNIFDDCKKNFLTTTSPPILLRVMLVRKIVCILNYLISVLFPSHFAVTFALRWCSPHLKLRVGLGSRILSLWVYDRELLISFHVQAVAPVMLVKPTRTSPSANISPLTDIPTSLSA